MCVSVDQSRCDQFSFSVDFFVKLSDGEFSVRGYFFYDAIFNRNSGVYVLLIDALLASFMAVAACRRLQAADVFDQYSSHLLLPLLLDEFVDCFVDNAVFYQIRNGDVAFARIVLVVLYGGLDGVFVSRPVSSGNAAHYIPHHG